MINATESTGFDNLVRNGDDVRSIGFFYPPIILRGDFSEEIEVVIRDDLTAGGMGATMYVYAYGYRIQ